MKPVLICALIAACGVGIEAQDDEPDHSFNCDRQGVYCFNDTTICTDSACICPEGLAGFDCFYVIASLPEPDACGPDCENGGTCVLNEAGEAVCYCTDDYYGATCEYKRIFHECSHDSMDVTIVPTVGSGTFDGVAYVLGQEQDAACILTRTDVNGVTVLTATLPYDPNVACGGAENVTKADGDTQLTYEVVLQYSALLLTLNDEQFTFHCTLRQSGGEVNFTSDVIDDGDFSSDNLANGARDEDLNPFTIEVIDGSGAPITGAQEIGTPLIMKFTLNGGEVYAGYRIESVIANNGHGVGSAFYLEIPLVEDGCIPEDVHPDLVTNLEEGPTGEIILSFVAFKFLYSDELDFHSVIRVCNDVADCAAQNCTEDDAEGIPGIGRRRRSIDGAIRSSRDVADMQEVGVDLKEQDTVLFLSYPGQTMGHFDEHEEVDMIEPHVENGGVLLYGDCVPKLAVSIACLVLVTCLGITFAFCVYIYSRVRKQQRHPEYITGDIKGNH